MLRFDLTKTLQLAGATRKKLAEYNPLKIREKETRAKALFALSLVCFFWGTTWLASKEGVRHMPALQLAGLRQLAGGLIYVSFFISRKTKWPTRKEWGTIIILSFLNFLLSNGLSTWAVKYISAGLGAIMTAIFPLWLVVFGFFSARTRIPFKAILGLLLGFGGVCVIFYEHLPDFWNPDFRFGILLAFLSTLSWALGTIYTKKHATGFNPYFSLGLQMAFSGATLTCFTAATGQTIPLSQIPWQAWTSIAYLVVFGSVISFIAFLYALQKLSTEQTSIYAYVNPIVAVLLGALIFGETLTFFIGIGGAMALYGVYLVNKAYRLK